MISLLVFNSTQLVGWEGSSGLQSHTLRRKEQFQSANVNADGMLEEDKAVLTSVNFPTNDHLVVLAYCGLDHGTVLRVIVNYGRFSRFDKVSASLIPRFGDQG